MHDDQLRRLMRTLDNRSDPDPAFADALFERLSLVARNERRSRGVMVLLAAALLTATLAAGAALGSGLIPLPWASDRDDDPVAQATPTPTAVASASAEPSGTPAPSGLPTDSVVRTTVDGLQLRESFSTQAESLGTLPNGSIGLVVGGPRVAEGMPWYLVAAPGIPPNSGCGPTSEPPELTCPVWFGWIAGADVDGTAWLAVTDVPGGCPAEPGADELGTMQPGFRIACYAGTELTLRGWYPIPPIGQSTCPVADPAVAWLLCGDPDSPSLAAEAGNVDLGPLRVTVDPASGVVLPEPGQWLEVTGHIDDPASLRCGDAPGDLDPAWLIFQCRTQFVVTDARPVSGP